MSWPLATAIGALILLVIVGALVARYVGRARRAAQVSEAEAARARADAATARLEQERRIQADRVRDLSPDELLKELQR